MKKIDVVNKLAASMGISKKDASEFVDAFIEVVKLGVKEENEVDFYGFVKFTKTHKEATTARSPKTGEMVNVPAKYVPKAKFSKSFKDFLNN